MNYLELYETHDGYLCHKHEQYLFIYDELLQPFIQTNQPLCLLEIGIQNGGSLELWEKYLPKGSKFYGVDIDPKCKNLTFNDQIKFTLGDATQKSFIEQNFKNIEFDIIIDDGSHVSKDIISTFEILFKKHLKMGGLYIIEDMHCCYWENYGGGFRNNNSAISYCKELVDALNYDYYKLPLLSKENKKLKELNSMIKKISFYDSVCAIEKFSKPKIKKFSDCRASDVALVENLPLKTSPNITKISKKINYIKDMFSKNL